MKISYAITVCNELEEIERLIKFLHSNKRTEDEICVLLDKPKASDYLVNQLYRYSSANWIFLKESAFQGHFADWKNELTKMCSGDYIFQIDADEIPNLTLIEQLPKIIEANKELEVMLVPRVNTVEGITQEHIKRWNWKVEQNGWVNWPDYQWRIYKNASNIKWKNKVHEVLDGFKTFSHLPSNELYSLRHDKNIEKQENQNNFYNKL
jgi:hypothetical protein